MGQSNTQGLVVCLYGLSGSGKSTFANLLNERLKQEGHRTLMLDGDSLRATINSDLGFADEDRRENIRRAAHIAQLSCQNDTIVIASFITPLERFRTLIREIVGSNQFCDPKIMDEIADRHDIQPGTENVGGHIRSVAPGNYKDKLKPDTISRLNETLKKPAKRLGYCLQKA